MKRIGAGLMTAGSLLAVTTLGSVLLPGAAIAQPATANVSVVTDYRFRGISQSFKRPALQGGADYAHASGFYVGSWGSTVDKDFLAGTNGLEIDVYGGYRFPVGAGWTMDVGVLQYLYPGESLWNTTELYVGGSWKRLSLKYSHSVSSDTFGFVDSRGSGYLDATAIYPLAEGLNLVGHVGYQKFKNYSASDYSDYRLGATYDWFGLTWGASVYGTSEDVRFSKPGAKTRDLGKAGLVLSVSKSF